MTINLIPLKLIPAFLPFLVSKKRYKFAFGGRGGGKSVAIADLLLSIGYHEKKRILCTREIQKSISDSVHTLLDDRVKHYDLTNYLVQKSDISNITTNTQFIFTGLREHNVNSLKSYQGINYCWVEEAHSVSQKSLDILTPTIREDDSEIWFSFNRYEEFDPVYKLFKKECQEIKNKECEVNGQLLKWVEYTGPDAIGVYINYDGNQYFPEVLQKEMLKDKKDNYDLYLHKWVGYPATQLENALISRILVNLSIKREVREWNFVSIGVDPARYGDDESVICIRHGFNIQGIIAFNGINTTELTNRLINITIDYYSKGYRDPIDIKVDDTGIGGGVTDQLEAKMADENRLALDAKRFNINVIPVINNGVSTNPKYKDYGTQMWGDMAEALKTIKIPDDEILITQLCGRKYRIETDNTIKLEKKDEMKKRSLTSPDRADALALCLAHGNKPMFNANDKLITEIKYDRKIPG